MYFKIKDWNMDLIEHIQTVIDWLEFDILELQDDLWYLKEIQKNVEEIEKENEKKSKSFEEMLEEDDYLPFSDIKEEQ